MDAPANVTAGTSVSVTFIGGNLRNDRRTSNTFLRVERRDSSGDWSLVAEDADPETRLLAEKQESLFHHYTLLTVIWQVPSDMPPADYRIRLDGAWLNSKLEEDSSLRSALVRVPYNGSSRSFTVKAPE